MRPDVITCAKALGNGMPIGACITGPEAAEALQPGDHGSTFAAGPIGTSAALAVLDAVDDPALLRSVRELGARLRSGLEELPGVAGTRGRGLMVGVALEEGIDAAAVGADLLERGLVVNVPAPGDPASAAAAGGRKGPDRPRGWTDRRIASRLWSLVSPDGPARRRQIEDTTAARLAEIVAAAEQAAKQRDRRGRRAKRATRLADATRGGGPDRRRTARPVWPT